MRLHVVAIALGLVLLATTHVAAQIDAKPYEERLYFPTRNSNQTNPLKLGIILVVGGQKLPLKTIDVTTIKKWQKPDRQQGESDAAYLKDLTDTAAAASAAKAVEVQKAINTAFAAEFQQLGQTATIETYSQTFALRALKTTIGKADKFDTLKQDAQMSMVVIPSVWKPQNDKERAVFELDFTGEAGGGGRYRLGGTGSTGVQGFMGEAVAGLTASGVDAFGSASQVLLGIDGLYVASLTPTLGESEDDILGDLILLLNENGIPATFDPGLMEVSLNTPLFGDQAFFWGNDDTGLVFQTSIGGVPEPAPLVLLGSGLAALVGLTWRRHPRHGSGAGAARSGASGEGGEAQEHTAAAGGRRVRSSAARDADQPLALLGRDQYPHRRPQRLTQVEETAFPLPTFVDQIER